MRKTPVKHAIRQRSHKKQPRKYGFTGLTLTAWATGAGLHIQTLEKMFQKQGVEVVAHKHYSIREFLIAVTGDKHAAEVRNLELDARRKEREEQERDGILVEWELVEKRINEMLVLPLIQALDAAPDGVSREWIEKVVKPALRQKMQPMKANGEK